MFSVGCAVQCRHGERTWGVSRGSAQECGTCGVTESRGLLYQRPKVPTLPPSWPALAGCGGQRMSRLSAAGIRHSRSQNGSGDVGEIRLDVRLPPIGEPIVSLLSSWARKTCERHTNGLRNERSGPCRRVGGAPIGRRPDLKQRGLASCRKPAALSGSALGSVPGWSTSHRAFDRRLGRTKRRGHFGPRMGRESDCSRITRVLPRRWRATPFARRKQTICLRTPRCGIWCHPGYCQPIRSHLPRGGVQARWCMDSPEVVGGR